MTELRSAFTNCSNNCNEHDKSKERKKNRNLKVLRKQKQFYLKMSKLNFKLYKINFFNIHSTFIHSFIDLFICESGLHSIK